MARPSLWFIVLFGILSLLGVSGCSSGKSGGGKPALNGPTNLQVTGDLLASSSLDFSWTKPGNSIDGYEFEAAVGSDPFTRLGTDLIPAFWTEAYVTFNLTALPEDSAGQQLLTLDQDIWSAFTLGPSDSNRPYPGFDKNDKFYLLQQLGNSSGTGLST